MYPLKLHRHKTELHYFRWRWLIIQKPGTN